ncbi:hypothetical protein BT67DRAFT_440447 [Trichocladium antarcticum]|uniref:Uncharacterized protein n=1 Tax=Trichocladium antarcticum TaxID=1450529 RepID=A0AAN6ZFC3_9PEZI|nr:hypothetical protein BT67DRAFT_440447 [Trichocladium antarcticum]
MATHPVIASEFNSFENSTWLITGFTLAGAATKPPRRLLCVFYLGFFSGRLH